MKAGLVYIKEERQSQIEDHGFSLEWQKENIQYYQNEELIQASKFCFNQDWDWPNNWNKFAAIKIIDKNRIGQLSCAGAFLLAHDELFGQSGRTKSMLNKCIKEIENILNIKNKLLNKSEIN